MAPGLRALRAALRVYVVGVAVMLAQLLRRLRGDFRPPGERRGVTPGSRRGHAGVAGVAGKPWPRRNRKRGVRGRGGNSADRKCGSGVAGSPETAPGPRGNRGKPERPPRPAPPPTGSRRCGTSGGAAGSEVAARTPRRNPEAASPRPRGGFRSAPEVRIRRPRAARGD